MQHNNKTVQKLTINNLTVLPRKTFRSMHTELSQFDHDNVRNVNIPICAREAELSKELKVVVQNSCPATFLYHYNFCRLTRLPCHESVH